MARYIDADAFVNILDAKADMALGTPKAVFHSVVKMINKIPTADVVEVVRCKDCRCFTGKDNDGCCIANGLATRFANDFCSYGKRKSEE